MEKEQTNPLSEEEQIRKLKQEIKSLKQQDRMRACMGERDTDIILTHLAECLQNSCYSMIPVSGQNGPMSIIIEALNKLAEKNNERYRKNYEDTMMRIKLIHKYQKYYEEALYYSSGVKLRGFTPLKYASFFSVDIEGKEVWPVSCYLN
jgi:hypothetical protein